MDRYKITIRGKGSKEVQGSSPVEAFSKMFPDMSLQTTHGNDAVANVYIELLDDRAKPQKLCYIATNTVQKQIYTEDTREFALLIKKRKEKEAEQKRLEEEKKRREEEKKRKEEERIRQQGERFRKALEDEYCSRVRKLLNMLTIMQEQDKDVFDKVVKECLSDEKSFYLRTENVPAARWAFQFGSAEEGVTFTRSTLDISDRKYLSHLLFDWLPFERNLYAGFSKYYGEGILIPNLLTAMPSDGAFYTFGALRVTDAGQYCFALRREIQEDGRSNLMDINDKDPNTYRGAGYFEFDAEGGAFSQSGLYVYSSFMDAVKDYRRLESQVQHWQNRNKYKTGIIRCTESGAGFATVGFVLEEDFDTL